jgi:hypothetical protein
MTRTLPLLLTLALALLLTPPARAADAQDFSPAEKLLFMADQLGALRLPTTLKYGFRKTGSMEEAFDDKVAVAVSAGADGKCCTGRAEFLTGARKLPMPDIEGATGNPVLMFFLEREVREMQRLTKGSQSHFRKRIRMAIYGGATLREVALSYRGKEVKGTEVLITPYLEDPNRPKYEKLAAKEYRFWLSDAVPGGVFGMRGRIAGATADAAPLLLEEVLIEGATAPSAPPSPGRS